MNPSSSKQRFTLAVGALGVVYGDIGTSPLYAMRECFVGVSGFPITPANVLGILSLIIWSLVLVVSVQFVLLILRADNQGEGGLLALAHLIVPDNIEVWSRKHWMLVGVGLFGAALLFGDGIITPALSVLSAVEGLQVIAPALDSLIVPITAGILIGLFAVQRSGTGRVGQVFGPIMLLWFSVLGVLGLRQVFVEPSVLAAFSPTYALAFFSSHGLHGTLILGAVFLTVTGAEALYADLGHFGRSPIQQSWFFLIFPCLLLNYLGQGALLLRHPEVVEHVFYYLAPSWALIPLVVLATAATIIASQAVISGVFSLTAQAVQLDYFPRTVIKHTSAEHRGQIYVPAASRLLLVGTLILVVFFRSSGGLADAYGIAVSLTMVLTTVLFFFVMRERWKWQPFIYISITAIGLLVNLAFFLAIARKIASGGWIPLSIAAVLFAVMGIWRRGRQIIERTRPQLNVQDVEVNGPLIFLIRDPAQLSTERLDPAKHLLLHINRCHRPYMGVESRGIIREYCGNPGVYACFGFMENPDVPAVLSELYADGQLAFSPNNATYISIRESPDGPSPGLLSWWLFNFMGRHAARVSNTLNIPDSQVVEYSLST